MNHPIIIFNFSDSYTVVYINGLKAKEGYIIFPSEWISLGMVMAQSGVKDLSLIKKVFIEESKSNIDDFPLNINDMHNTYKNLIN